MFGTDLLQPTHIILILVVALVVLGPKRLPEVGRSLGRGLRDFRAGMSGVQDEARGMFSLDESSDTPEDSAVSLVPEPVAPATVEPEVPAFEEPVDTGAPVFAGDPVAAPMPARNSASVTKVAPVEADPADYAD